MTLTQTRQQAAAMLVAAATPAGARVYDSRTIPLADTDTFPILVVYTPSTSATSKSMSAPAFSRTDNLQIVGFVEEAAAAGTTEANRDKTLAAALDTLEEAVRATLLLNATWVAQFERVVSANVERGRDSESDRRRMQFVLTIVVQQTEIREPTKEGIPNAAAFQDFDHLFIDVDLAPPDGVIEASAEVDL